MKYRVIFTHSTGVADNIWIGAKGKSQIEKMVVEMHPDATHINIIKIDNDEEPEETEAHLVGKTNNLRIYQNRAL